jgi:hypothetical protein
VGDKIQTTAGGKDATGQHRINNGTTYTITAFDDQNRPVLDNGWTLPSDFKHWKHGYVETSYAVQGNGQPRIIVVMDSQTLPAVDMKTAYTTVTRGKESARIYTGDKEQLREHWVVQTPHLLASDLVRKPRKRIKEKLKRHVAFLRQLPSMVADRVRDVVLGKQREGNSYGY